jgi:Flp pilus assembly pilin Flp
MTKLFGNLEQDESGASLIEYVLIAALISIIGIGTMITISGNLSTLWGNISSAVTSAL